ncbi:MAG: hypothetical protein ACLP2J_04735 [Acidimicrobiales bacterium]
MVADLKLFASTVLLVMDVDVSTVPLGETMATVRGVLAAEVIEATPGTAS